MYKVEVKRRQSKKRDIVMTVRVKFEIAQAFKSSLFLYIQVSNQDSHVAYQLKFLFSFLPTNHEQVYILAFHKIKLDIKLRR